MYRVAITLIDLDADEHLPPVIHRFPDQLHARCYLSDKRAMFLRHEHRVVCQSPAGPHPDRVILAGDWPDGSPSVAVVIALSGPYDA